MHLHSPDKPLLETVKLRKSFERGKLRVLEDVTLQIQDRETIAIVGPNGSGKTTLLNILGALRSPDDGDIFFRGKSYQQIHSHSDFRNREIGFVFQFPLTVPVLTAEENIMLPLAGIGTAKKEARHRAHYLLELAGCSHLAKRRIGNFSAGEKQRIAICRAFVNRPKLVLADEPTGFLDRENRLRVMNLMEEFNRDFGTALVIATNDNEVADRIGKRYSLRDGRLL